MSFNISNNLSNSYDTINNPHILVIDSIENVIRSKDSTDEIPEILNEDFFSTEQLAPSIYTYPSMPPFSSFIYLPMTPLLFSPFSPPSSPSLLVQHNVSRPPSLNKNSKKIREELFKQYDWFCKNTPKNVTPRSSKTCILSKSFEKNYMKASAFLQISPQIVRKKLTHRSIHELKNMARENFTSFN